jgi:hypothetical protein
MTIRAAESSASADTCELKALFSDWLHAEQHVSGCAMPVRWPQYRSLLQGLVPLHMWTAFTSGTWQKTTFDVTAEDELMTISLKQLQNLSGVVLHGRLKPQKQRLPDFHCDKACESDLILYALLHSVITQPAGRE